MLRVLYISYTSSGEPLFYSQVLAYLERLAKKDVRITLLTFEKGLRSKQKLGQLKQRMHSYDIEWRRLRYHKRPHCISTFFDIAIGVIYSSYLAITRRIDVIHARSYVPACIALFVSKVFRRKFIFDMRGMMADEYKDAGLFRENGFIYKVVKLFERIMIKKADSVIVLTKKIAKQLPGRQVGLIPCCIDVDIFKPRHDARAVLDSYSINGKLVFLYSGSLGTWYMLQELIDFFKVAHDKIENSHFLILTHTDQNMIYRAISSQGLPKECVTVKRVDYQSVPRYIAAADVGVLFYKPTFSKQATSPVKFGEYLACGLPVIVNSGVGDTEEIVSENRIGSVIKDFKRREYVEALDEIDRLLNEGDSLRQRCRQISQRYLSLNESN